MNIETKFKIGEEVYLIIKNEDNNNLEISKDKIKEVVVTKTMYYYWMENFGDEVYEDEIAPINRKDLLVLRITEMLENKNEIIEK